MGAWKMLRDPSQGWIHVGGSLASECDGVDVQSFDRLAPECRNRTAVNEGDYYSPGSFHIDYGTHAMGDEESYSIVGRRGGRKRDWFRAERGRLAGEPGWLDHDHDAHALAREHGDGTPHEHHHGTGDEWNGQFPTGEFCG